MTDFRLDCSAPRESLPLNTTGGMRAKEACLCRGIGGVKDPDSLSIRVNRR